MIEMSPIARSGFTFVATVRAMVAATIRIASTVKPNGRPRLVGPSPARASLTANQAPNTNTSHTIPTMAPGPPPARLKKRSFQCCSSPTRRSAVTARVMIAGTSTSSRVVGRTESGMAPPSNDLANGRGVGPEYTAAVQSRRGSRAGRSGDVPGPAGDELHRLARVGQGRRSQLQTVAVEGHEAGLLLAFPVREQARLDAVRDRPLHRVDLEPSEPGVVAVEGAADLGGRARLQVVGGEARAAALGELEGHVAGGPAGEAAHQVAAPGM